MTENKKHLSFEDKNKIVQYLLGELDNGVPKHGKMKEPSILFGTSSNIVHGIWITAKKEIDEGKAVHLVSLRLRKKINKKNILNQEKMKSIHWTEKSTIRDLADDLEVSKSTVGRWIKDGQIKTHTNVIKPALIDLNKVARVQYSLSQLYVHREDNIIKFNNMHNVIHIDEKWFYITKTSHIFYKLPIEENPHRFCKSKRFITKVMFICDVGRTLYSSDGTCIFDGKIWMFPFTEEVEAVRNSKNRLKGTIKTKNIESITKEISKVCLMNQILSAIKEKWPANASKEIWIQQDNVKPHISNRDPDFRVVACSDGFNIQLVCQPANSPDTNINDLGCFTSIQALQQKKKAKTVVELVENVVKSFEDLTTITLNKVFLRLQGSCIEIMKAKGDNNLKTPHMKKDSLSYQGLLPDCLEVDESLVKECIDYLMELKTPMIWEI